MNKIESQLVERWRWSVGVRGFGGVHTKKGTGQEPLLGTQVRLQDGDVT